MKRIYIPPVISLLIITVVGIGATALILHLVNSMTAEQLQYVQQPDL